VGRELSAGSGLEAELKKHTGIEIHGNSLRVVLGDRKDSYVNEKTILLATALRQAALLSNSTMGACFLFK
jgi:hypothetical protein